MKLFSEHQAKKLRKRAWLFKKHKAKCYHCGGSLRKQYFRIHHIIPRSQGGTNARENLAIVHPACEIEYHKKIQLRNNRLKEKFDYMEPSHPRHEKALLNWMCATMLNRDPATSKKAYLYVLRGVWDL